MSQNPDLARSLGTRHRAAIGITEETDAVCVVVSEETSQISVAVYGKLTRALDGEGLRKFLTTLFKPQEQKATIKDFLEKNWKAFREKT